MKLKTLKFQQVSLNQTPPFFPSHKAAIALIASILSYEKIPLSLEDEGKHG